MRARSDDCLVTDRCERAEDDDVRRLSVAPRTALESDLLPSLEASPPVWLKRLTLFESRDDDEIRG